MTHRVDAGVSPFAPLFRANRTWAALRRGRRSLVRLLGFRRMGAETACLQNRIFERDAFWIVLLEPFFPRGRHRRVDQDMGLVRAPRPQPDRPGIEPGGSKERVRGGMGRACATYIAFLCFLVAFVPKLLA